MKFVELEIGCATPTIASSRRSFGKPSNVIYHRSSATFVPRWSNWKLETAETGRLSRAGREAQIHVDVATIAPPGQAQAPQPAARFEGTDRHAADEQFALESGYGNRDVSAAYLALAPAQPVLLR
jgi:hypothetical protein